MGRPLTGSPRPRRAGPARSGCVVCESLLAAMASRAPPRHRARARLCLRADSDALEARAAVHGPIVTRQERDGGLDPARRADDRVHLAWLAAESFAPPRRPAFWAALRLVHQALLG